MNGKRYYFTALGDWQRHAASVLTHNYTISS
jgi:hypothetical protein